MTKSTVVVKSPNDAREYRVLKLSSGLTALLISDLADRGKDDANSRSRVPSNPPEGIPPEDSVGVQSPINSNWRQSPVADGEQHGALVNHGRGSNHDVNTGDKIKEDGDVDANLEDEDELEDMLEDDSDMVEDDNMIEDEDGGGRFSQRAHSKQPKLAAAALCIGVGSFIDPPDLPGLAHFLEHMVFMGSDKHPDENSFDAFIKKHGGSDNASTDCEQTTFILEVHQANFRESLTRFAEFFTAPLLKASTIDREIEAVDSEFQMSLLSDHQRKQQLLGMMSVDGHPMGKFMWGNSATLKVEPLAKDINVHSRLCEFRKRVYSAQYMTLAVQSRESLDTLKEWVLESFSDIPNNHLEQPRFCSCGPPFSAEKFHKLYKVVPVQKVHCLDITWSLPNQRKHYRCKPLNYISWLIGHEGKGSLLSLLKSRSLSLSLYSGNSDSGFEHNETHAMFAIMVTLTERGFQQVTEVLAVIFQYIKMLQTIGPQRRIFDEIKSVDDIDFRFQEETDPIEYVENVAESMQLYPAEEYLTGPLIESHYDEKAIVDCTDLLRPSCANFMLSSSHFEDQCELKEPWFETKYSVEDVPVEWSRLMENLDLNPDLYIPEPNRFIATNFDLKTPDVPDTSYPECILTSDQSKLWFKRDTKFKSPRGFILFHLVTPLVYSSPENLVLFDFFVSLLEHNLSEIGYEAEAAKLDYRFKTEETGLVVKMAGFNHKLPLLFDRIVGYIANFSAKQELFDAVKEEMVKSYYNHIIKPSKLNNDVRLSILQLVKWTPVNKRGVVHGITRSQVLEFAARFKKELFIEGLVQGNFTAKEALSFEESLRIGLGCTHLPKEQLPKTRVIRLPGGDRVCKVKGYNGEDPNSVVTNYYQSGPGDVRKLSTIEALVMMMEEPCFDILRTQEQLGYSVFPMCRNSFGIVGFTVTVASQATKFSVSYIAQRIESFLQSFHVKMSSSEDDFKTNIDSLITLKRCEDSHLEEEVDRNWWEILTQTYLFDRLQKEVEALQSITLDEVSSFLADHIRGGTSYKMLSAQVVGAGNLEKHNRNDRATDDLPEVIPMQAVDGTEPSGLTFLPLDDTSDSRCIDDFNLFKANLQVYPVTKIDN